MAPVFIFLRPPPLNCDFFEPTMKFLCATVWKRPQKCLGAEAGDVMDSSAGKPWVSEMDPLQVSMAERTNRRKHCGNPVILQHWTIINTQRRGRKPLLILKSMLRAGREVHSTHSCTTKSLFFRNGVFSFFTSPFRSFFWRFCLLWALRKAIFLIVEFISCIFSKCLERPGDWCITTPWGQWIKVWMAGAEVLWISGNQDFGF